VDRRSAIARHGSPQGEQALFRGRVPAAARGARRVRARRADPLRRAQKMNARAWPAQGDARVPYWVYTDEAIYRREIERIFEGPTWSYVALECELPKPGDWKRSWIGEKSVLVVRGEDGAIRGFLNRCAHRGVQLCQETSGHVRQFRCPYHQW